MKSSTINDFRLKNHTYEIIATANPFEITCHVVNLLGALIVFVTLGLLYFTDIGLGQSILIIASLSQIKACQSLTKHPLHCLSEFIDGYLDKSFDKRNTRLHLTYTS